MVGREGIPLSNGAGEEGEESLVGAAGDPAVLLAVTSSSSWTERFEVSAPDVQLLPGNLSIPRTAARIISGCCCLDIV